MRIIKSDDRPKKEDRDFKWSVLFPRQKYIHDYEHSFIEDYSKRGFTVDFGNNFFFVIDSIKIKNRESQSGKS